MKSSRPFYLAYCVPSKFEKSSKHLQIVIAKNRSNSGVAIIMTYTGRSSTNIALAPTETILQILGECHEISSQLNIASTCQRVRHIWLENIVSCVSTAIALTVSELEDAVMFAKQEHSKHHAQQEQAATVLLVVQNHNEQVYRWLPSIVAIAEQCELLRKCYFESLAAFNAQGYPHKKHISHQYPGEDPSSICKPYLAIRRSVLGYNDFDFLRQAYADIHASNDKDLDDIEVVAILLKTKIPRNQLHVFGISLNEPQQIWWGPDAGSPEEYVFPLEWEFTFYIICLAAGWRFDHPEDGPRTDYEEEALSVYEEWDHDRVNAMWGSIERPWERLSPRWQWRDVNGRKEWYKDGRHIPRLGERDFHDF
jgi:hypothetical protein